MKKLMLIGCSVLALGLFAAPKAKTDKPKLTPEERQQLIMKKVGGFIEVEAKGSLVVVNAQSTLSADAFTNVIALARKNLQIQVDVKEGKFDLPVAAKAIEAFGGTAGLFIVDDPALPMSLVSHEELWGVVNLAPLKKDAAGEKLEKRAAKEFNRVLAFTFSSGLSRQNTSVMKPIATPEDLDSVVNTFLPFDVLTGIFNTLPKYGITRKQRVPYRKACQEGWAPAPTNEFQQAIWDKVHELPSKPITIEK